MKNIFFAILAFIGIVLLVQCKNPAQPPDIILILADDLGYSDLGCYGSEIKTPNLDQLAHEGLLFNQMYSCGRCWPSRSTLLTGHYPRALNVDPKDRKIGIPSWPGFIPQYLSEKGYRSYHSGKWHVHGYDINNAGFDKYYFHAGYDRHFNPENHNINGNSLPQPEAGDGYYSTVGITDYMIDFISQHIEEDPESPFFGYVAYISPHFPLHALPEDIKLYRDSYTDGWDEVRNRRYSKQIKSGLLDCELSPRMPDVVPGWNLSEQELQAQIGPGEVGSAVPWEKLTEQQKQFQATKMALHAAMVHRIDQEVGKLVDVLKKMGRFENTVIMFLSDNGASAEQIIRGDMHDKYASPGSAGSYLCLGPGWSTCANTPFKRHKYWMDEGGISSPFIVSWPEGISKTGDLRTTPCHFIDILPTILNLAGVESLPDAVPELPGRTLVPAFGEDTRGAQPFFYFDHRGNKALRKGKWKILSAVPEDQWELYDLESDRSECNNLAQEHPELVNRMVAEWNAYREYLDSLKRIQ